MNLEKRIALILLICIPSIGCDQVTKSVASDSLSREFMTSYLFDIVRIGYTENQGAFLGLGSSMTAEFRFYLLTVIVGAVLLGLVVYLITNTKLTTVSFVGLSLVFSGGLSNFYDRASNDGTVIDFLNIGIGTIRTGVFNVADMVIMAGLTVLIASQYLFNNRGSM